jgi:hypothetical protein
MKLTDCMKNPESTTRSQAFSYDFGYAREPLVTNMQHVKIMPVEGVVFWQQDPGNRIFPGLCNSQAASPQGIDWVYS